MNFIRKYVRLDSKELNNKFEENLIILTNNQKETMGIAEFLLEREKFI